MHFKTNRELSNDERISWTFGGAYFCSQFIFKRRNIVDTMTDFKSKMRAKEAFLNIQLILSSLLS